MKESENRETNQEQYATSRRSFLKGAVVTGAATALSGVLLGTTGCDNESSTAGNTASGGAAAGEGQYSPAVYESDVLIVGGGVSGLIAARTAMAAGVSVNVVDKGPWGHSGASGINWGHDMQTGEFGTDDGRAAAETLTMIQCGMPNQTLIYELMKANMELKPNVLAEQMGMIIERNPDGTVKGAPGDASDGIPGTAGFTFTLNHGFFSRYYAMHVRNAGARIFDRTRVLNILLAEDGSTAGAVAIDVRSGSPVVFRAKKTILATGSYACIAGDNGLYPYSMTGPENTGDGHAMLINAGRQSILETKGCIYLDSSLSFGLIRGGHVDATVLGALEVDQKGVIANWIIPNGKQLGVGGAMDLVAGANKIIVGMAHTSRGKSKLVKQCSLPITGIESVDVVVTDLGIFSFEGDFPVLLSIAPEVTVEEIRSVTELAFEVAADLQCMLA